MSYGIARIRAEIELFSDVIVRRIQSCVFHITSFLADLRQKTFTPSIGKPKVTQLLNEHEHKCCNDQNIPSFLLHILSSSFTLSVAHSCPVSSNSACLPLNN